MAGSRPPLILTVGGCGAAVPVTTTSGAHQPRAPGGSASSSIGLSSSIPASKIKRIGDDPAPGAAGRAKAGGNEAGRLLNPNVAGWGETERKGIVPRLAGRVPGRYRNPARSSDVALPGTDDIRMIRSLLRKLKPAEPTDRVIRKAIPEIDDETLAMIETVLPYTMTSIERLWAMAQAVRHVAATGVMGDIVECGVWKGGNLLLAGLLSERLGMHRTIWGYDTYAGMSEPTDRDVSLSGASAWGKYRESEHADHNDWCYAPLADVHRAIETHSSYRDYRFVVGKCEDTLRDPANLPDKIAVLRLDTDWYESTKAEIETLYPRLQPGGILIVDDYGHWGGARQAIDEYFHERPILLLRIDYTGRIHLKT